MMLPVIEQSGFDMGLAPMEGVTDLPFRLWMSSLTDISFLSTPFLRTTKDFPKSELPSDFIPDQTSRGVVPYRLVPQIMTDSAESFIRNGKRILEGFDFVDFNCGCPSPHAVGGGAGSSLLADPKYLRSLLVSFLEALGPHRVSVKIRTGFQLNSELNDIFEQIYDLPLARLTIHGRSRVQKYDGLARWELIDGVAAHSEFPVYASGDITSLSSLEERLPYCRHIAGMIIGRGALRNPFVFEELRKRQAYRFPLHMLGTILVSLGLLYELKFRDKNTILTLLEEGTFKDSFGTDISKWLSLQSKILQLSDTISLDPDGVPELSRAAFGRVKMIWNYLRSSFPKEFFAPTILRSATMGQFLKQLNEIGSNHKMVTLSHKPDLDWIYTSRKKQPSALNDEYR